MSSIVECAIYDAEFNFVKIENAELLLESEVGYEDVSGFWDEINRHSTKFNPAPLIWESVVVVEQETLLNAGEAILDDLRGDLRVYSAGPHILVKAFGLAYLKLLDESSLDPGLMPPLIQAYLERPRRPGVMTETSIAEDSWECGNRILRNQYPHRAHGQPDYVISCGYGSEQGKLKICSIALVKE